MLSVYGIYTIDTNTNKYIYIYICIGDLRRQNYIYSLCMYVFVYVTSMCINSKMYMYAKMMLFRIDTLI